LGILAESFRLLCARVLPGACRCKPLWLTALAILAGCAGGGGGNRQVVRGDGFRFEAPGGWEVRRGTGRVQAADGHVDLVSVRTFRLVKPYTPQLFPAASTELDRVADQLAQQLKGRVASRRTLTVAGRRSRAYRIDYGDRAQEITFVLEGRREYQLLCRRDADAGDAACRRLVTSFALA
jgi:hypothetical protein